MNAPTRQGIPLRPDPVALRDTAVASLCRAAIATGIATLDRQRPAEVARARFGDDRAVDLVLRAAVSPTTIASAPALTQIAVAFLATLVPMSAGAALLERGIQLNFSGAASISVPRITMPAAGFVGELKPIPVQMGATSSLSLVPHKLAVITTLSREVMSSANAETLVRQALVESTGPSLDTVLFGSGAATADQPAGLLNGITPLTPAAAGGSSKGEVLVDDIQKLATAIAPVAGNGGICLIASPDAAVALVLRLPQSVEWPVFTSSSLGARTVIAVATNAVVSAVQGVPQIDASTQATLHRDSVPGELVDIGGVVARPVGSLFQSDLVALRLKWPISWCLRSIAGLAWMTGVNW